MHSNRLKDDTTQATLHRLLPEIAALARKKEK
jgi:hypothetical protein